MTHDGPSDPGSGRGTPRLTVLPGERKNGRTSSGRGRARLIGVPAGDDHPARPGPAGGPPGPTPVRGVSPLGVLDWRPGGAFTLGAEEELVLVDGEGRLLGADAAALRTSLCDSQPQRGAVNGEIFVDQVELDTPVCADGESLAGSIGDLRSVLVAGGARPMAVGVHPEAAPGSATIWSTPRYDQVRAELAGLLRTPTSALQVHVALPDEDSALLAYRLLRNRMCVLRGLSVGSPFWHGYDSGLASARSAVLRSYPRVTVPPVLRCWDEYRMTTERIVRSSGIPDHTHIWWDLRPRPAFGTLEVRVMDVQPDLARVAGLAALVQGLARLAVDSPGLADLPDDVVAANDFRVCRHGLDTTVVDVDGRLRPARALAADLIAAARAVLRADGTDRALDVLDSTLYAPSEADHQRRVHAERGMDGLLTDLVDRTTSRAV